MTDHQIPEAVLRSVDTLMQDGGNRIIAIDGRCASGKTTLAERLRRRYGCNVVHMDHFFLRPEQRSPQRLNTPGENVDHERFLEEVLLPLKRGEAFSYRPFDCSRQILTDPVEMMPNTLTVVEGSYSCHMALWGYYDLRIFLTVEPEEQLRRIVARNGDYARVFRDKWIPLEEAYFTGYDLQRTCDLWLSTDP